jgi:hypothetical protein
MDADRFDAIARALTTGLHRRTLVAALGTTLAPLLGAPDATAHELAAKCKKLKGDKKKNCLKKAKKHKAQHASQGSPPTSTVSSSCGDGMRNGGETDVDCGGPCPPCADGKACIVQNDCQSRVCTNNLCRAPTCNDGVKNGNETDVDCGGGTCPDCAYGQSCAVDADCEVPQFGTSACCENICAECCDHTDCKFCDEFNQCTFSERVCENRTCRGCSSATAPATNWCALTTTAHGCGIVDPDRGTPCHCIRTVDGDRVCTWGSFDEAVCSGCTSDADCPSNHVCVNADGCCQVFDAGSPVPLPRTLCVYESCQ